MRILYLLIVFIFTSCLTSFGQDSTHLQIAQDAMRNNDYYTALHYLGLASRVGNHEAQYLIGTIYRDSLGVKANFEDAAYWFRKAASNGHAKAQYAISQCFATGKGVLPDKRVAAEWCWRAAQQGLPEAQYQLGIIYLTGDGMPLSLSKALFYFELAAKQNYSDAAAHVEELRKKMKSKQPNDTAKKNTKRNFGKKRSAGN